MIPFLHFFHLFHLSVMKPLQKLAIKLHFLKKSHLAEYHNLDIYTCNFGKREIWGKTLCFTPSPLGRILLIHHRQWMASYHCISQRKLGICASTLGSHSTTPATVENDPISKGFLVHPGKLWKFLNTKLEVFGSDDVPFHFGVILRFHVSIRVWYLFCGFSDGANRFVYQWWQSKVLWHFWRNQWTRVLGDKLSTKTSSKESRKGTFQVGDWCKTNWPMKTTLKTPNIEKSPEGWNPHIYIYIYI